MRSLLLPGCLGLLMVSFGEAVAEAAPSEATGRVDGPAGDEVDPPLDERAKRRDRPWIRRWRPERNMVELGVFGGVFVADVEHDLYDPRTTPPEPVWQVSPDVGLRLGFSPLRFLGVEAEFSAVPTRMRTLTDDFVFLYGFRGHVVAQLPFGSVVPFVLGGFGLLGVRSNVLLLGDDVDPAAHYGGGLKIFLHRHVGLRLEARHILSARAAREDDTTHHVQVLAGLVFTFNRARPKPLPPPPPPVDPDRDRDGIPNPSDRCPDAVGLSPHGCPDTDGDGFLDPEDACPDVPGVAPHGCPPVDGDDDGYLDPEDACPEEPETYNAYQDDDGCPDTVPPEVQRFTGTIEGIEFEFDRATIRPASAPVLDDAVRTLAQHPDLRVRIVGHADDVGTPAFNLELSRARAAAVRDYLVEHGIAAERITVEGKGAAEPLVPNTSPENRAKNRRIEFQVLGDVSVPVPSP